MENKAGAYLELSSETRPYSLFVQGLSAPSHYHRQMEIFYIFSGTVTATINGNTRELSAGEMYIAESYDIHSVEVPSESEAYVIIFAKSDFPEYEILTQNRRLSECFYSDPEMSALFAPVFRLLKCGVDKKMYGKMYYHGLVSCMLGMLSTFFQYKRSENPFKAGDISNVLAFINDNLTNDISLSFLARHFGYSPTHFSSLFNKITGFHLRSFLNMQRAQRALSMIENGSTILSAALNSGFSNIRTFYRTFTQLYGTSPVKYLKVSAAAQ